VTCSRGQLITQKCGTPAFMAPEQHLMPARSRGYSFPVDVWAAGLCMYMVMFGGRHPFLNARRELNKRSLLAGDLNFAERTGILGTVGLAGAHMSADIRGLCQHMVTVDPQQRISVRTALGKISHGQGLKVEPGVGKKSSGSPGGLREQMKQQLAKSLPSAVVNGLPRRMGALMN